jgi:hypothetical protein
VRILLINQNWFAPELRKMGHEVLTCGMKPHLEYQITQSVIHIDELLKRLPNGFQPDRIVWLDHSGPVTILGLEDCDIPKALYSVDTHHHYARHAAIAHCFDHVFVAQKDYISHFANCGAPVSWLPLWASEYVANSDEKKHDVVFVGTLDRKLNPARVDFFEEMKRLIPIEVLQGHFPSIFPHAEIVLNQTVKGDLNFRVFEAMMCGALLLTESSGNGLLDLFEDGAHLVTYTPRDPKDAAAKASRLIADKETSRRIAAAGRREILMRHTAKERAKTVEQVLLNIQKRPATPERHLGAMTNLFSISLSAEAEHPGLSKSCSTLALQSALRALSEGHTFRDNEIEQIIKCALRHDILVGDKMGAALIERFYNAFPKAPIFALLKLRTLLNSGRISEATSLSLEISPGVAPQETFAIAERAAGAFIEQAVKK